jgi:hypothetical protein
VEYIISYLYTEHYRKLIERCKEPNDLYKIIFQMDFWQYSVRRELRTIIPLNIVNIYHQRFCNTRSKWLNLISFLMYDACKIRRTFSIDQAFYVKLYDKQQNYAVYISNTKIICKQLYYEIQPFWSRVAKPLVIYIHNTQWYYRS